jgi:hypothetical protein
VNMIDQFNNGVCEECGNPLVDSPYVGGDHDPIAICSVCCRHYGCWACDELREIARRVFGESRSS